MSYQPFPNQQPAQPVVQQPGAPFASPAAAPGKRRTGLLVVGALALLGGIGGGLALVGAGATAYEDGVRELARAPLGCTTTLEFESTGEFNVFVETQGEIGRVRGDCSNADTDYEYEGRRTPDVELSMTNEDGDEVDVDDGDGPSYDTAGFVGEAIGTIEIDEPGDYLLTVSSDDEDFAVAIGKDPKGAADTTTLIGYVVLAAGVVLGLLLIVLGLKRRPAAAAGGVGSTPSFAGPSDAAAFGGGFPPAASPQYPATPPAPQYPTPPPASAPAAPGFPPVAPPPSPPSAPSGGSTPAPPTVGPSDWGVPPSNDPR